MINGYTIKKSYAILALILLVTFSFNACTKEDNPIIGSITVTTAAPTVGFVIRTQKGSPNLTIDWGDGEKSDINNAFLDEFEQHWFTHEYSSTTEHTIVITGPITDFNCRSMQLTSLDLSRIETLVSLNCSENKITTLDVSTNTLLNILECDFNQLTSLDVSKNSVLSLLSCVGNKLTTSALNDLFKSLFLKRGLEYNGAGFIFISHRYPGPLDNPGVFDCDRSIAEVKGWEFMTLRR